MKYVNLGGTGLKVSRLCLGTMTYGSLKWRKWILPEKASRPFIQRALELGINFFDTADVYSMGASEQILGRALKDFTQRDQVVIGTKVYNSMGEGPNERGLSRVHIMNSIEGSLRRLGTDYVDLYQIHRWDSETPIEETLEALHDLVKAGDFVKQGKRFLSFFFIDDAEGKPGVYNNVFTDFGFRHIGQTDRHNRARKIDFPHRQTALFV